MKRTVKAAIGMVDIAAMSIGTLAACGGSDSGSGSSKGKVYYLNYKPETNDAWKALAKKYTKETGVEVKVQTAASETYPQTLKSELAKSNAPTLFQINGVVDYQTWKAYTTDMSDTEPYKQLKDQSMALKDGSKVVGVPYVVESYGLIYNKDLLAKYIATDGAKIKDVKDIDNFDTLKAVADDIQAKKDQLGVKGAFTSAGFDFQLRLALQGPLGEQSAVLRVPRQQHHRTAGHHQGHLLAAVQADLRPVSEGLHLLEDPGQLQDRR